MGKIDPGAPGKGGGEEGFNAMSTHKIILNRNTENALRRNIHNWGTNMFLYIKLGLKISAVYISSITITKFDNFTFRFLQK